MLRLEAEAAPLLVGPARLAADAPVEEVPRVELHPWLGRQDLEHPAASRLVDPGCKAQHTRFTTHHEVVVVPPACQELRIGGIDTRTDRGLSKSV